MKTKRTRTQRRHGGFTLIEVAIATAMIGVAIVALLTALAAGTRTNSAGRDLSQAVFLSQAVREWTLTLPYTDPDPADEGNPPGPDGSDPQYFVDDLDDLLNVTYSPPRNSMGQELTDMIGWSQVISVTYREPDDLETVVTARTDVARVEVTIEHNGQDVLTTGWLVTR
ncbi:MAG: type IV pilus modification PilV family protein [Phycisphaerae bacterium]